MNHVWLRGTRTVTASGAACLGLCLVTADLQAQAWLPEKGNTSVSLAFSNVLNKKHFNSVGNEVDVGHTDLEITTLSGSWSPSDRWLVNASLPYVSTRHRGPNGGGHNTAIDNGSWHGTVTDLLLTVHYQVTDGPIAFAPYVGLSTPTHNYVSFGHAAPGRRLDEYWLGLFAATSLNEWIPRTYVQTRVNYAFVEEVQDIGHDRTNASLEIGYYLNESVSARLLVTRQWTHGGIDVPVPLASPLFPDHDRLAAEELTNVGLGASWNINKRLSVYGLYLQSVDGTNAHKVDHHVSLGMSYGTGGH